MALRRFVPVWVWAAIGALVVLIVLIVTVEPVRLTVHAGLNALRRTPLEVAIEAREPRGAEPTGTVDALPPDAIEITVVREPEIVTGPTRAQLAELPFEMLTVDPPNGFDAGPSTLSVARGAWDVQVDLEKLQPFLRGQDIRIPLPPSLRTQMIQIVGGATVVTRWAGLSDRGRSLTLVQLAAPRVTSTDGLDLEPIATAIQHEFLPPVIARQIQIAGIPLVRDALGISAPPDQEPRAMRPLRLPDGRRVVWFNAADSLLVLVGPLSDDELLDLAAKAKPR